MLQIYKQRSSEKNKDNEIVLITCSAETLLFNKTTYKPTKYKDLKKYPTLKLGNKPEDAAYQELAQDTKANPINKKET